MVHQVGSDYQSLLGASKGLIMSKSIKSTPLAELLAQAQKHVAPIAQHVAVTAVTPDNAVVEYVLSMELGEFRRAQCVAALQPGYDADASENKADTRQKLLADLSAIPKYADQIRTSESDASKRVPEQSSAAAQMLARLMRDLKGETVKAQAAKVRVPKAFQAALDALLNEYDADRKTANAAVARHYAAAK